VRFFLASVATVLALTMLGPPKSAEAAAPDSHVFVVVMENKEYSEVIGSGSAPYLNRLANRYASATRMFGVSHPSLPNYLAMLGGSTFGVGSNCTGCDGIRAQSFAGQLEDRGLSWRAYMDGMPSPCFRGSEAGRYVKKHNPFAYFRDISGDRSCRRVVPASRLAGDLRSGSLADFNWITPDLCHDSHDCSVGSGDQHLAALVPDLLAHTGPQGFVALTYDEGSSSAGCCRVAHGGHIPTVLAGPPVRRGAKVSQPFSLYSLLRTLEDTFGVGHLRLAGCSCTQGMGRMFTGGSPPRLPTAAPRSLALTGGGLSAQNSFTLSWSGASGQPARVNVEICGEAGSCSREVRGLSRGQHALRDVRVPAEGRYTARVWLDAARGSTGAPIHSNPVQMILDRTSPDASLRRAEDDGSRALALTVSDAIAGVDPASLDVEAAAEDVEWTPLEGIAFDEATGALTARAPAALGEGVLRLRLQARDLAGNELRFGFDEPVEIVVDVTPPSPPLLAADQLLNHNDFTLSWRPEEGEGPARRVHARLCTARDAARCAEIAVDLGDGQDSLERLAVPGEGAYTARIWLEDRYRNADPGKPSNAVRLVYDATAPVGAFEPSRERTVSITLQDPGEGSGVASCRIEAQGGGALSFRAVPSSLTAAGRRCSATMQAPDVGPGLYALRAIVRDRAGNEATIDRGQGGAPATTFVRFPTQLSVTVPRSPAAYGSPAHLSARLSDERGGVGEAEVELASAVALPGSMPERTAMRTDSGGLLRVDLAPGPNRLVRLRFLGDAARLPSETVVRVPTAAATTFSWRSSARLAGRLLGREGDPSGTVTALEAPIRGRWRLAGQAQTDGSGGWSIALRPGVRRRARSARLRLKPGAGYPYDEAITQRFPLPRSK
jgi:hypothetical protein